ncbi:MAG: hypothetical protein NTW96_03330 [Planctomycetia bacterium]|nr:hypothetical protein [Planctomycetia bacterium]
MRYAGGARHHRQRLMTDPTLPWDDVVAEEAQKAVDEQDDQP